MLEIVRRLRSALPAGAMRWASIQNDPALVKELVEGCCGAKGDEPVTVDGKHCRSPKLEWHFD